MTHPLRLSNHSVILRTGSLLSKYYITIYLLIYWWSLYSELLIEQFMSYHCMSTYVLWTHMFCSKACKLIHKVSMLHKQDIIKNRLNEWHSAGYLFGEQVEVAMCNRNVHSYWGPVNTPIVRNIWLDAWTICIYIYIFLDTFTIKISILGYTNTIFPAKNSQKW